ncbi:MAG: hypothetical protein CMP43_00920 [Rickettsiales bacterium]|nr:hypothetical protein [Rickettsiales bacterium]
MKKEVKFLGIDIGGAHIKLIGLNKKRSVCFANYRKCYVWKGLNNLKKEFEYINDLNFDKKIICGITMTAELCDIFKSRKVGANQISDLCKTLKYNFLFYSKQKNTFTRDVKGNYKNIISMNWHAVGRYFLRYYKNLIIIDFGSTTTDFICIKDGMINNIGVDDLSRLSEGELIYTGVMRTPLFSIQNKINYKSSIYYIIPELFSSTSDLYRVNNFINKNFDVDDEADHQGKSLTKSLVRISRSFAIDYKKKNHRLLIDLSKILIKKQIKTIEENIKILKEKKNYKKNVPIFFSGIGRPILINMCKQKEKLEIKSLINANSKKLEEISIQHMPAYCVAQLISD